MPDTGLARVRWIEPPTLPEEPVAGLVRLGLPATVCRILVRRGFADVASVRAHLRPRLDALPPPDALPDLGAAMWRIEAAIAAGERILVHGDYDADGMCAAALLALGLRALGGGAEPFVPHRTRDGYDLSAAGVARAREIGATLIVTADCGIVAHEAVASARSLGIDAIVTDHHRPGERLPPAVAVVNPARRDSAYPFRHLAGVGVAFRLLSALYRRARLPDEALNQHLDLVAIGTIADQMPLAGENRILVAAGLRALARTRKPGLRALVERAALADRPVDAALVAWGLAPRLNSVGRMASAEDGLRLLLAGDADEARRCAERLEEENVRRRREDRAVYDAARERLGSRFDAERDRAVVVWGEGWHPGVIGIAASRLVEALHRPVVVVSLDGDVGRGSGRSFAGFHLYNALRECEELLERYGGHRMAVGLTVRRSRVEEFAERLLGVAAREIDEERLVEELAIDLELPLADADAELSRWLTRLGPFGAGNPAPLLLARGVTFEHARSVGGEGRHLRALLASPQGGRLAAIGFGLGGRLTEAVGGARDAVFELGEERWRGARRLQARLRDFRPATS